MISAAAQLVACAAARRAVAHRPKPARRIEFAPVNRACVAGPGGCLACDAKPGEPCRRRTLP